MLNLSLILILILKSFVNMGPECKVDHLLHGLTKILSSNSSGSVTVIARPSVITKPENTLTEDVTVNTSPIATTLFGTTRTYADSVI